MPAAELYRASVSARWLPDQRVEPVDASICYRLAASFGTGGEHMVMSLLGFGASTLEGTAGAERSEVVA